MFRENCIQTRFGGVRLPSTIEQFDETFTDLGDFVVVKKDSRNTVFGDNFSVCRFPVLRQGNCVVHLLFDLTQNGLRLVDFYKIPHFGGQWGKKWTLSGLSHPVEHLSDRLLILSIGLEAVPILSGNLKHWAIDRVSPLVDHLLTVRIRIHENNSVIFDWTECAKSVSFSPWS